MKTFAALLFTIALAFGQSDVKRLDWDDIKQLLNEKVFFLDVRGAQEIEDHGTVKGYVNIPIDELEQRIGEVPKNKRIVTACAGGGRAAQAATLLKKNGYEVVGACGLVGAKDEGIELIYPKAQKKN